jgi:hypothetical protein
LLTPRGSSALASCIKFGVSGFRSPAPRYRARVLRFENARGTQNSYYRRSGGIPPRPPVYVVSDAQKGKSPWSFQSRPSLALRS